MTSIERDESNFYGAVCKPEYSILTYTWGRWKIRDAKGGPALPVLGTSWKIPAVREEHFTVKAFQSVVQRMSSDSIEWAWIDIACIDQENAAAQAEEVGRQASIFKNARRAFVWLSHLQTEALSSAVQSIQEHGLQLRDYIDRLGPYLSPHDLLHSLHKELNVLFDDPWFSSLWTLQEVVLRNDALVLSAQAEPIWWESNQYMYLTMFINHCQNMFKDFAELEKELNRPENTRRSQEPRGQEMKDLISEVKKRILQAGFYYLFTDNPNVQYGTARYRTTSRDVDRIYAIMQIYNLRVGKSIRPHENPSLDELVDEFALAINQTCLIMGQLFVHTEPPPPGKSWRITRASTVPDTLMNYKEPRQQSTVTKNALGNIVVTCQCCPFPSLLELVRDAEQASPINLEFRLALDETILHQLSQHPLFGEAVAGHRFSNGRVPGWPLLPHFGGQNLWVLLLGDIRGEWDMQKRGFDGRYVGSLINCGLGGWSLEKEWQDIPHYRLGVCTWEARATWHEERLTTLPWKCVQVELY